MVAESLPHCVFHFSNILMTDSIFSKIHSFWKPLAVISAVVFVYAAILAKLGKDWWTNENYSHGLIVPFVIGYIVWLEFGGLQGAVRKSSGWRGALIILLAFLMLLAGTLGAEVFTQRVSLIVMLAGIIIYFFGAPVLRNLIIPFALLLLAIPIPQIIFNKIAFPLQLWASQAAVWGIRLFEIPTIRKGNVIELLPQGASQIVALEVVEACSGIRSLMTLVTLALVLAYFTRVKVSENDFNFVKGFDFWRALILMLAAIPIAVATNAGRVSMSAILTYHYGVQAADGLWHEFSGWLVFLVAFILLMAVNFGLKKIQNLRFKNQNRKNLESAAPRITNYGLRITNSQTIVLIVALFFGGMFINRFEERGDLLAAHQPLQQIPMQLGEWRQKGTDTRFGEATEAVLRTSDYVMRDYELPDGRTANLYVGYYDSQRTGATYHSPQNCLPGAGWEMKSPELIKIETPSGETFTANRYIIQNGDYREVLIYWYEGRGRRTASEYLDKIYTVFDSVRRRRSDGAMVRVMTAVGTDETESLRSAVDLSAQIADRLAPFVPD